MSNTNRSNRRIHEAFEQAMTVGLEALAASDFDRAWPALERAHILGQTSGRLHLRSHWWMLRAALRQGDTREVVGQVVRVALALPSSWLDRFPRGNNGRARVGLLQEMPIPRDLEALLAGRDP